MWSVLFPALESSVLGTSEPLEGLGPPLVRDRRQAGPGRAAISLHLDKRVDSAMRRVERADLVESCSTFTRP